MANGKIANGYAKSSASVTSGAGTAISVVFNKIGRVCSMRIINGSFTGNAFETLITIPQGFEPLDNVDYLESYGGKRVILNGNTLYCAENLSSTPLRGSATYISAS